MCPSFPVPEHCHEGEGKLVIPPPPEDPEDDPEEPPDDPEDPEEPPPLPQEPPDEIVVEPPADHPLPPPCEDDAPPEPWLTDDVTCVEVCKGSKLENEAHRACEGQEDAQLCV